MPRLLSYTEGSDEPVSVADAQLACRIGDELDPYVTGAIVAARRQAELITGRAYRGQVQREELEDWPSAALSIAVYRASAVAIAYRSAADPDNWTTLATTVYRWSPVGNQTRVNLAEGQDWPELATEDYGVRVRIDLTCGPASASDVPEEARLYILASVAGWVDNPGDMVAGNLQANPNHERLLDGERVRW